MEEEEKKEEKKEEKVEKFSNLLAFSKVVNAYRLFPRLFIGVYILLLWETINWFMSLPDPNTQQASLISTIVGVGAAWFGLYVRTNGDG